MADMIHGKYRAFVVKNEEDFTDPLDLQPYKGCIKVICPDLLGFATTPVGGEPFAALKELMTVSGWVTPCFNHSMDFLTPELGEGVFVEPINGNINDLVYVGFYPGDDFISLWDGLVKEGINTQVTFKTDRIIGVRNGSYIKLEDTIDGKVVIEAGGKNKVNATRKGVIIEMDPFTGFEKFSLTVQDKAGGIKHTFIIDSAANGKIEAKLQTGEKMEIAPASFLASLPSGEKVSLSATLTTLADAVGNAVELSATGIKLVTSDAATWAPCIIPNCLFTGASHGGAPAGIVKLTGG
jgi:hypothetical protein